MKSNFRWVKCILIKEAFFLIVPMTCIYLTVTYIHITLEVRIPSVCALLQDKCKEFLLRIQRPKMFNSLSSAIQNASSTAVFTSKLIKSYFLSLLFLTHFCIICSLFFFLIFSFFCALLVLVLPIFIAFSDYFLCYKQIYCICLVKLPFQCQCRLFLILGIYILKVVLFIQGRTIRKVMGGEFLSRRNFFRYQIPCMNFF